MSYVRIVMRKFKRGDEEGYGQVCEVVKTSKKKAKKNGVKRKGKSNKTRLGGSKRNKQS